MGKNPQKLEISGDTLSFISDNWRRLSPRAEDGTALSPFYSGEMSRPTRNKKVNHRIAKVEEHSPEGALIDGSGVAMDMKRNELNRHAGTMNEGDSLTEMMRAAGTVYSALEPCLMDDVREALRVLTSKWSLK